MSTRALIVYYGSFPENRGITQLIDNLKKMEISVDVACRDSHYQNEDLTIGVFAKIKGRFLAKRSWFFFLLNVLQRNNYHIVFYREIPLFVHLLAFSCFFRFRLVGDIRENLSGMYMSGHKVNLIRKLIAKLVWPTFIFLAKHCSDFICFSTRDLARYLLGNSTMTSKWIITPNYPTASYYEMAKRELRRRRGRQINIIFSGHIKQNRGLDILYLALCQIDPRLLKKFKIFIVGDGEDRVRVENLFHSLNGADITFTGMVHPNEVVKIAVKCDVGFMAYSATANSSLTYPGKLFEYFACGLHVISTERKSLRKLDIPERMITYYKDKIELAQLLSEYATANDLNWNKFEINSFACRGYSQDNNVKVLKRALNGI
ncbi:glycosyltransferase [Alphaproteobacteria bacterium]|nr:glycosyltransferase [Alphaproteobacteria bacterium]